MPSKGNTMNVSFRKNWRGSLIGQRWVPFRIKRWIAWTGPVGRIRLGNRPWEDINLDDIGLKRPNADA